MLVGSGPGSCDIHWIANDFLSLLVTENNSSRVTIKTETSLVCSRSRLDYENNHQIVCQFWWITRIGPYFPVKTCRYQVYNLHFTLLHFLSHNLWNVTTWAFFVLPPVWTLQQQNDHFLPQIQVQVVQRLLLPPQMVLLHKLWPYAVVNNNKDNLVFF